MLHPLYRLKCSPTRRKIIDHDGVGSNCWPRKRELTYKLSDGANGSARFFLPPRCCRLALAGRHDSQYGFLGRCVSKCFVDIASALNRLISAGSAALPQPSSALSSAMLSGFWTSGGMAGGALAEEEALARSACISGAAAA